LFIALDLSGVCLAKTDDPNACVPFREAQHVHTVTEQTDADVAHLAVVLPTVHGEECAFKVKVCDLIKTEPALPDVPGVLCGVVFDLREI
jgi:hypothetical protein